MNKLHVLRKADNAASPTFFCDDKHFSSASVELIDDLEVLCQQEKRVVRICLHSNPADDMHNMIIAHPADWYVRPHASPSKTKTYQIIKGKMLFVGFNSEQNELFRFTLDERTPVFRLQKGVFIFLWAQSDVCIFHEIAIGPFDRDSDTVFAKWAPSVDNPADFQEYIKKTIKDF